MADSRPYPPVLEQSRRHWHRLAVGGCLALLGVVAGLSRRSPFQDRDTSPVIPEARERVIVEVLNGTHKQGAARTATRVLRRQGVDVVFLGNADSLAESTRVIVRRGDSAPAHYVAAALGSGVVVVETDTFRRVDVSVILGDDFRPKSELHP